MLEWLKEILGDSYTEEIDKKVSAEIGKAFAILFLPSGIMK